MCGPLRNYELRKISGPLSFIMCAQTHFIGVQTRVDSSKVHTLKQHFVLFFTNHRLVYILIFVTIFQKYQIFFFFLIFIQLVCLKKNPQFFTERTFVTVRLWTVQTIFRATTFLWTYFIWFVHRIRTDRYLFQLMWRFSRFVLVSTEPWSNSCTPNELSISSLPAVQPTQSFD